MSALNNATTLLLPTDAATSAYEISRSVRFLAADSSYLSQTATRSPAANTSITFSFWLKLADLSSNQVIVSSVPAAGYFMMTYYGSYASGQIWVSNDAAGSDSNTARSNGSLRDPSAWYHIVYSRAHNSNGILYINGVQQTTQATNTANIDFFNGSNRSIGRRGDTDTQYGTFYLAEFHCIDGQALTPSSFGQTDANGVWQPKQYTGTYGSYGFYLPFSNNATSATLGTDASGNNNTWTVNNISATTGGPTSVAASSGALPVYNTTDTYGTVKGSGTRTDSNSSSIVLALPMDGSNGGTTFTEESATIKGSGSAKTINRFGNAQTSTALSKYYGSSGLFDGTGDYLTVSATADLQFGAGDFCIEFWWYPTGTARQGLYHGSFGTDWSVGIDYNGTGTQTIGIWASSNGTGWNMLNADGGGNGIGTITIQQNKWQHIAYTRSGNIFRLFINGVLDKQVTASGTIVDRSGSAAAVGAWWSTGSMGQATGNLQDFRIYKGIAKYTSNFNTPNSTQNPTVGIDNDSFVDSPTNGSQTDTGVGGEVVGNYCTLNPLTALSDATISRGNLRITGNSAYRRANGTIAVSTGKWYWEVTLVNAPYTPRGSGSQWGGFGFGLSSVYGSTENPASLVDAVVLQDNAYLKNFSGANTDLGISFSAGDVLSCAVDLDANTFTFRRNNTQVATGTIGGTPGRELTPVSISYSSAHGVLECNFGARSFVYTAPSGFKALCTANLPTPTIIKGNTAMDAVLYTGNGSTQTISGLGFSPDFVWIKRRDGAINYHILTDIVRGNNKQLFSNDTIVEESRTDRITAFNSDGFTLGSYVDVNNSAYTYVGWTWDAGSSTVSNNSGTINSQVRVNTSAGFSIVSYSQGATGSTVGHGLNVAPHMIIAKSRTVGSTSWDVYHRTLGKDKFLYLNNNGAVGTYTNYWGSVEPTSSTFGVSLATFFNNTGDMIAYCFAPVGGYSAFGSYTGSGSATDAPFIYTGFRPRWILFKNSSVSGEDWWLFDTARNTSNAMTTLLTPNTTGGDATSAAHSVDALSNGFKIRTSAQGVNGSSHTIIYAAFAENPFKIARAR